MVSFNKIKKKLLICVSLISTSLFMYEVVLSRVFSVILSYHYVFLITSIAILGMGLGSIFEYKRNNREKITQQINEKIGKLMFQLAFAMLSSFLIIYILPYMTTLVYVLISILPYFYAGRLMTTFFTVYGANSSKIYFADLMGAGIAALASITLFYWIGFIPTISVLFIITFLSVFIWNFDRQHKKSLIISGLCIVIFIASSLLPNITNIFNGIFNAYLTSPTTSLERLSKAGIDNEIIYTKWDGFARTDVINMGQEKDSRVVTINGSSNAAMLKWDESKDSLPQLQKAIDFLPYIIGNTDDVAIIGAGGGRDVLQALVGGAKQIDAIEINQSTIDAVKEMGEYNGYIYEQPEVNILSGDGRSIIANSNKKYDVIFASLVMTGTSETVGYAMAESYIYTEEALKVYYDHLKPNGKLVFVTHGLSDMFKVGNTAYKILENKNIPQKSIKDYMIIGAKVQVHEEHQMVNTPIVMISNKSYTDNEINEVDKFFEQNNFQLIHLPSKTEHSYFASLSNGQITLKEVYNQTNKNIVPATDERPYFYNYNKGIPDIFIGIFLIIIILILLFFVKPIIKEGVFKESVHFSLLGSVFMMIEIGLIQKMTLFLEHPTIAFVVTASSLLIGAGIGSYFSNHKYLCKKNGRHKGPLGAAFSLSITILFLTLVMPNLLGLSLLVKIMITIVFLLFNGFFMGTIFPYSIKIIKISKKGKYIPLFYGMNGVFSVFGSSLAIIISMQAGISMTTIIGIVIYLSIYIFMPVLLKS